jgi:asparagine synthase (glutamine-hydrolysing)
MTWLPDDILVKLDRATMHSSIEGRCPYLDIDLASYAAAIPPALKLKGLKTKYILKRSLSKVLPKFILNKAKSGFNAPVGDWIGRNGADEFKKFNRYVYDRRVFGKSN